MTNECRMPKTKIPKAVAENLSLWFGYSFVIRA
jgi:hypothetical protein